MSSLLEFIKDINERVGVHLPERWSNLNENKIAQNFLEKMNEYFFQTHDDIGETTFNDEEVQYFSEFHKYWETHHLEIINAKIADSKTAIVAAALDEAIRKYGRDILDLTHETHGISKEAIASVRFFSANQDFREPPEDQFAKFIDDPTQFDAAEIHEDPGGFLQFLGTGRLSQTDKRLDFAKNAAGFLLEKDISAYQLSDYCGRDALGIREVLISASNIGYGLKKANMLIRDMVEMEVWPDLTNLEKIDVASDINTMKLALRTGILTTEIPLVSSFLDIFCHQYAHIDQMSANAWRHVWQIWKDENPRTAPASPCFMDFLLYRIGREYCRDNVIHYSCTAGHKFYHFGQRLKKCRVCTPTHRAPVQTSGRFLPCQVSKEELPRDQEGNIILKDTNLLRIFDGVCILENACAPRDDGFHALDPPKSISIKGQTGWTNSYAYKYRGGGGMMG